jgi:hypothetical protein
VDVFAYLSVLVSIIIGLGMAHLLAAMVRIIHDRSRIRIYWPSLVWATNLFLILTLTWWTDFSLSTHRQWNFAAFLTTLSLPAILYVVSGLVLPASHEGGNGDMRVVYFENRVWFQSLAASSIALSFLQTYLLDGHIDMNLDAGLKLVVLAIAMIPIFTKADWVQKVVALFSLAWVLSYIFLLFANLPQH